MSSNGIIESEIHENDIVVYEPTGNDIVETTVESETTETGTTSFLKTCFNGLNSMIGIGILSTPYALAAGGWFTLLLFIIIAGVTLYTGILIKRCMDVNPTITGYPDIGNHAFGKKGKLFVSILMNMELYMVATGLLIVEGDNLEKLFPSVHLRLGGLVIGARICFLLIVTLIILPTVCVDNLSILSYVSATGVLASVVILLSVFSTGAFEGVGFHQKGTFCNWSGFSTSISLYAFCYGGHPVFPALYSSMKKKQRFSNVLVICFILSTVVYAAMAIVGYLMFGAAVQSQIVLNLPTNKITSKIAIYTTLINPISKYALVVTPITNITKGWFASCPNKRFYMVLSNIILVTSTVIIAMTVPFFGLLMSLVGAFLSVSISVIFPCVCFLKISGAYQRFKFETVVLIGVIIMGVVVVVIGTYTSVDQLIGKL